MTEHWIRLSLLAAVITVILAYIAAEIERYVLRVLRLSEHWIRLSLLAAVITVILAYIAAEIDEP